MDELYWFFFSWFNRWFTLPLNIRLKSLGMPLLILRSSLDRETTESYSFGSLPRNLPVLTRLCAITLNSVSMDKIPSHASGDDRRRVDHMRMAGIKSIISLMHPKELATILILIFSLKALSNFIQSMALTYDISNEKADAATYFEGLLIQR